MDNQNNNYTNFNGYQPAGTPDPNAVPQQPVQQPVQQPPMYGSNQQIPYNPYQVPVQQESKHKSIVLGILSIVIPIISCTYLSPIGLILAIMGVRCNQESAVCGGGRVISLPFCASLAVVIYILSLGYTNPDQLRTLLESSGAYTDEQIEELMGQFTAFIISAL